MPHVLIGHKKKLHFQWNPDAADDPTGPGMVRAPGVIDFHAVSLDAAKDTVLSLFHPAATRH